MASFPDVPDVLASPSPQALLRAHPNTHAIPIRPSPHALLRAYLAPHRPRTAPSPLASSIAAVRHHQLPRSPIVLDAPTLSPAHAQGMSPKKAHEVARMTAYVAALVRASAIPEGSLHIVDVGAGQGYLTRALKARLPRAHVLALDADEAQTAGAQKWEKRVLKDAQPPIAHKTVLIGEGTLLAAVDEWITEQVQVERSISGAAQAPVPVVFVALHACGSLTPDVLRAFIAARHRPPSPAPSWYPAAAVAVGCCYNLMRSSDFPLSSAYRTHHNPPDLPPAAFHLAAQIPSTWVEDSSSQPLSLHPSAALAIRKVVWRALLERALKRAVPAPIVDPPLVLEPSSQPKTKSATVPAHWPRRPEHWASEDNPTTDGVIDDEANAHLAPASGMGLTPAMHRLGRLRDAAYTGSWDDFLALAATRMGVLFPTDASDHLKHEDYADGDQSEEEELILDESDGENEDDEQTNAIIGALPHSLRPQARSLASLHVLRCIIGVLVETAILKDRAAWVAEELVSEATESDDGGHTMQVQLVNLFDQNTGSGRNVAIVLAHVLPATTSDT